MWPNSKDTTDLLTFAAGILNGKLKTFVFTFDKCVFSLLFMSI